MSLALGSVDLQTSVEVAWGQGLVCVCGGGVRVG